jgi:hypothetical protein
LGNSDLVSAHDYGYISIVHSHSDPIQLCSSPYKVILRIPAPLDENELADLLQIVSSDEDTCAYCLTCCTTGFKIELPYARAGVCFVTDHLIYQPARRRCSLQTELLHVIKFSTIFAASPAGPSIKVQRICQFSRQYSR